MGGKDALKTRCKTVYLFLLSPLVFGSGRRQAPQVYFPFDLPPEGIAFEELEKGLIVKAMERAEWVIGKAAPLLWMSLQEFAVQVGEVRDRAAGKTFEGFLIGSGGCFMAKLEVFAMVDLNAIK